VVDSQPSTAVHQAKNCADVDMPATQLDLVFKNSADENKNRAWPNSMFVPNFG
jgi:hypothetical protein